MVPVEIMAACASVVVRTGVRIRGCSATHLNEDGETTRVGLGALGVPCRDGGRLETGTETRDDTTDDELRAGVVVVERGDLDEHTDGKDNGAAEHHATTTKAVTEHEGEDGAAEAANFIDGDVEGLEDRGCREVAMSEQRLA